MSNIPITSLPGANPLTGEEAVPIVQAGTTKRATTGAISALPFGSAAGSASGISFVTVSSASGALPNSRTLAVTSPVTLTDSGAGAPITIGLAFTPGTGTVTSVGLSGGTTGLTISNSPVTTNGTMTIGGFLNGTSIATNSITFSQIQQVAGLSVVGVAGTATGNLATITGTANYALQVSSDGTSLAFRLAREVLIAVRTYYVRTDGSNSNTGLVDSAAGAFLTWQKAYDVASQIDNGGFAITIKAGNEGGAKTFNGTVTVNKSWIGSGQLIFEGPGVSPGVATNCTINGLFTVNSSLPTVGMIIRGLKLSNTGGTYVFLHSGIGLVSFVTPTIFGAAAAGGQIVTHNVGATVYVCLGSAYTIDGGADQHVFNLEGEVFIEANTVTITGTPAFNQFHLAQTMGRIQLTTVTYVGSIAAGGSNYAINGGKIDYTAITNMPGSGDTVAAGGMINGNLGAGWFTATGTATILSATGIPAGGTTGSGYRFSSTNNYGMFFGSGVPTLSAAQGSLYLRSDGNSTTTRAYLNSTGTGTWVSVLTSA